MPHPERRPLARLLTLALATAVAWPGLAAAADPVPAPAPAQPVVPPPAVPPPAVPPPAAPPGDGAAEAGTRLLGFAASLVQERDFYRAITEYKRFIFLWPDDPRALDARLAIAAAYRDGDKLEQAAAAYLDLAADLADPSPANEARFQAAECYYRSFQYAVAAEHYRTLLAAQPDHPRAPLARYRLAWTAIGQDRFAEAEAVLRAIPAGDPLRAPATRLQQRLLGLEELPHKSPALAGVLSGVLPGAGQLYAGRLGDGLLSLVVTGVFSFGTYEAAAHENYTAAGVMGLFALGFYLGNVFGAVNAAQRENDQTHRSYVGELVRELQNPTLSHRSSLPAAPGGVGLVLRW